MYAFQIHRLVTHYDAAGTKLELELERKKYQSILDDTFEKQGKDLQDVVGFGSGCVYR